MIRYEKKNSLITQQAEAEQKFLVTFEAGAYTASSPLVVRNPSDPSADGDDSF